MQTLYPDTLAAELAEIRADYGATGETTMQTITPLNEKQLRASLRHASTKPFAFCNIAAKSDGAGAFQIGTVQDVIVYGRGKSRTVAIRSAKGRRKSFETLGTVPADANGYALAAEWIENWLEA